ncbi:hypothetical protein CEXT_748421 [Caerostris extrusa]|uniref:Uncharacterized protein n=1 Tax=Caerostris extrusa TaxID=172846 RepID=A0AAV4N7C4_CAEEX|nr:hypothetical protein CEXT_748421 [Caerostris extrusa]
MDPSFCFVSSLKDPKFASYFMQRNFNKEERKKNWKIIRKERRAFGLSPYHVLRNRWDLNDQGAERKKNERGLTRSLERHHCFD